MATIPSSSSNNRHFRKSKYNRRQFLGAGLAGATATSLGIPWLISRHALAAPGRPGANDRIAVGAIGVGGRASLLLEQLPESAQIVALSDCNLPRAEAFKEKMKGTWPLHQNYHELLARKDVDAVIVGTGDFQRVLPCIHACQAGKDVYAEKPLTLYISEGRALVKAVRKYERVLQVGTQQRSMEMNRIACELVRNGGLGKLLEVRAINYTIGNPSPAPPYPEAPVPPGLDWNLWLNQGAARPYHDSWMEWMEFREFAGGQMTNWGAHGVDQIQWALGMDETGPVEIKPLGEGPNSKLAMRYHNGSQVNFVLEQNHGPMGGAVFIGEKGKLEINRNKFSSNPPEIAEELLKQLDAAEEERKWSDTTALWQARWHMQNWIDCIHSRQRPVADVEIGHRSVTVCHLANIARLAARPLHWNPATEQFVGDADANTFLSRDRRKGFELPEI